MKSYFIQFLAYSQQQLPYLAPTAPRLFDLLLFPFVFDRDVALGLQICTCPKKIMCMLATLHWCTGYLGSLVHSGVGVGFHGSFFSVVTPLPSDYTCFVFLSCFFLYLIAKLQEFGVWGYLQRHTALVRFMYGGCCCSLPDLREAREAVIV